MAKTLDSLLQQKKREAFGSGLQYCNSRIGWFLETTVVELPLLDRQMRLEGQASVSRGSGFGNSVLMWMTLMGRRPSPISIFIFHSPLSTLPIPVQNDIFTAETLRIGVTQIRPDSKFRPPEICSPNLLCTSVLNPVYKDLSRHLMI